MLIPHPYRQCDLRFQEREGRLCHEVPPEKGFVAKTWETTKGVTRYPAEIATNLSRFLTNAVGVTVEWATELFLSVPVGIAKGMYDRLQDKPDTLKEYLRKAVSFCKTAPPSVVEWAVSIFEEQRELTPEAMANLMDLRLWIIAFEKLNLKDVDSSVGDQAALKQEMIEGQKQIDSHTFLPLDFLQTLTPLERRERFATLTTSVIPVDAQKEFTSIFGSGDPTDRRNAIADAQNTLIAAMKKMYGLEAFQATDDDAQKLARASLTQLLFLSSSGGDKKFGASAGLKEEFEAHLKRRPGMLTPEGIRVDIAKGIPEVSLLLGAINAGVVKQGDIDRMMPALAQEKTEIHSGSARELQALEKTTRVREKELKRAGETMSERFEKAPGWAKLAIVVGLIGGVMKFPKTSAAIGAFLAGKYFLMKDNNPIDATGQTLLSAIGFLRGAKVAPPLGPSKEVEELGTQVLHFLPNRAHENINASVTGFTLLAGMDVSLIAANFDADDKSGRMGTLRAWDQPLKAGIRESIKTRGMDGAAAARFFPSGEPRPVDASGKPTEAVDCSKQRNLCETGDALASFFYLLGEQRVQSGTHTRKTLDMATLGLIEQARKSATSSGYYDDIGDTLTMKHPQLGAAVNIRDEYYHVMLEGIEEAKSRRGVTLEQVLRELAARLQNSDTSYAAPGSADTHQVDGKGFVGRLSS